jgi:hypothetical protein
MLRRNSVIVSSDRIVCSILFEMSTLFVSLVYCVESTVRWFVMRENHYWMAADSADKSKRTGWRLILNLPNRSPSDQKNAHYVVLCFYAKPPRLLASHSHSRRKHRRRRRLERRWRWKPCPCQLAPPLDAHWRWSWARLLLPWAWNLLPCRDSVGSSLVGARPDIPLAWSHWRLACHCCILVLTQI